MRPQAAVAQQMSLNEKMMEAAVAPGGRMEEFHMPRLVYREDPGAYLEAFKKMTTAAGWDRAKRAYQLGPLLIELYTLPVPCLSWEEAEDYQTVKAVI